MTKDEAIKVLENRLSQCRYVHDTATFPDISYPGVCREISALEIALAALRPVSREQVEKVWRGEWVHTHSSDNFWTEVWKCSHCDFEDNYGDCFDFCPFCGTAKTDEAVQMVMERMEGLKNES